MRVESDFDPQAGFSDLRTYSWMEEPAQPGAAARSVRPTSDLVKRRIERAVDAELARKGYQRTSTNPDFKVGMLTIVDEKVDVDYINRYYGYRRTTFVVQEAVVSEYLQGTLVLDIVDAKKNELIWRGSASGALPDNPTPERVEKTVNEAVAQIMERFPPDAGQ